MEAFLAALNTLPFGTFEGQAYGRTYIVTRQNVANGRGEKLVAEALDGSDYISLNLYRLQSGVQLRLCEMPAAKVVAFVCDLTPL
ncbi:MAG: hypothetical protein AAFQ64_08750 [Pseudomonadota bacterium]